MHVTAPCPDRADCCCTTIPLARQDEVGVCGVGNCPGCRGTRSVEGRCGRSVTCEIGIDGTAIGCAPATAAAAATAAPPASSRRGERRGSYRRWNLHRHRPGRFSCRPSSLRSKSLSVLITRCAARRCRRHVTRTGAPTPDSAVIASDHCAADCSRLGWRTAFALRSKCTSRVRRAVLLNSSLPTLPVSSTSGHASRYRTSLLHPHSMAWSARCAAPSPARASGQM